MLACLMVMLSVMTVQAQERTYSGTVTSADDGQPIIGANVMVAGTTTGTSTGVDGKYTIKARSGSQLVFSFLGMRSQTITVGNTTTINVSLQSDATSLEDVVVVAFGTAKKKDLTGSISTIDSKIIQQQQVSSISKALEGAVAGVEIASIWGQPGADATIQIRGMGSISSGSSALVVVDGVPSPFPLSSLNPNDIESITISKDAASNSLYGSRGANGVVLVTTKKGKQGKTQVSFEGRWGINQQGTPSFDMIKDPGEFYEYAWRSIYNRARYYGVEDVANPNMTHEEAALFASKYLFTARTDGTYENPYNDLGNYCNYRVPDGEYLIDPNTGKLNPNAERLYVDNWDDYFSKNRFRQEYNVNISGASEKTDYYMSMGYLQDPSYIAGSDFRRYSARFTMNTQINKWLRGGFNMSYARRDTKFQNNNNTSPGTVNTNVFAFKDLFTPVYTLHAWDLDGNIKRDANGDIIWDLGTGQTDSPYGTTRRSAFTGYSPAVYILKDRKQNLTDDLSGRAYLEATFLKDFKFTANISMDNMYDRYLRYGNNESGIAARDNEGTLSKTHTTNTTINSQQLLTWNHDFGKHHVDALLGHEYYWNASDAVGGSWDHMLVNDMPHSSNTVRYTGASSSEARAAIEGYFFRGNYNYANKYYFSASVRADGTTKFSENKWGVFWSVGGSWRINQEDWMQNASWVNDLKLRVSYGTQGNQGIGGYPSLTLWTMGNAGTVLDPVMSLSQGAPGNPDLTWETSNQIDAGIDFRFWDRFYGSIDYYHRKTVDMIWARPMPVSTGLSSRTENIASMLNEGVEIELGVDIIRTPNVLWSFSVNGAHNTNQLLSIPPGVGSDLYDGDYVSGNYIRGVGKDYYTFYLCKYAGVDQKTGLAMLYRELSAEDVQPGAKWEGHQEGELVTTTVGAEASRFEMGTATPDFKGGFSTYFRWKNLDLSILASYQIGGNFLSLTYNNLVGMNLGRGTHKSMWNAWSPENRDSYIPMRMLGGTNYGTSANGYTDFILFDASYFNLKNITLGYNFPEKLMQRWGMGGIRVYAAFDNVWLATAIKGLDPRTTFDGGSSDGAFGYPQQRSMSLGLNITF